MQKLSFQDMEHYRLATQESHSAPLEQQVRNFTNAINIALRWSVSAKRCERLHSA